MAKDTIALVISTLNTQEHLERQAVSCLTPMITLEKMVRGKRTSVSEPLFPNYLFVE
ncbi:hypothetical protein MJL48_31325, partial [Salmonella enterica subsp. enterica serovar Kentucky]|nr:hypothetical protein [Salmonella enterica subsp. enterica serovar Kentucky]